MSATELDAFMSEPIEWREFEEVALALLDQKGGDDHSQIHPRPECEKEADAQANQGAQEG